MSKYTMLKKFKKINNDASILLIMVIMFIILSISTPLFLTTGNIINLLLQATIVGIVAIGSTYVIISGNFDLSVGAIISLTSCISIELFIQFGLFYAIILTLLIGAVFGFMNGFIVARGKIDSFIATLAMAMVIRSIILIYTDGYPRYIREGATDGALDFGNEFLYLGGGRLWGYLPVAFLILIVAVIVFHIILTKTRFGRYIYAVGCNSEAARVSGVDVPRIQTLAFVIGGITAALAGIVFAARIGTALPNMGDGYELRAIAAVVIGGTSLSGGRGGVINTLIGTLIFTIMANGLNLLNVSAFYQNMATGIIILIAVLVSEWSKRLKTI